MPYNYKPIFTSEPKTDLNEAQEIKLVDLTSLDAGAIANGVVAEAATKGFYWHRDNENLGETEDALRQLEKDNERDVQIMGQLHFFSKDLPNLTKEEMENLRLNYPEELDAQVERHKKIKKLENAFGKENVKALIAGYSQSPGIFIARTLERSLSSEHDVPMLYIKNPPLDSRRINITCDDVNTPLYEEIELYAVPIIDGDSHIVGYFNPGTPYFRFGFERDGTVFQTLATKSDDVAKIFYGKQIPETRAQHKYTSPQLAYEGARYHFYENINVEGRDQLLIIKAISVLNFVDKTLLPLIKDNNDFLRLLTSLIYDLTEGIKDPAINLNETFDEFLINLRQLIYNLNNAILSQTTNNNDPYLLNLETYEKDLERVRKRVNFLKNATFELHKHLSVYLDAMPHAVQRIAETRLQNKPKELIQSVAKLRTNQKQRYSITIESREPLAEVQTTPGNLEDIVTKSYTKPESGFRTLTPIELANSKQEEIQKIKRDHWLKISSDPNEVAFVRDLSTVDEKIDERERTVLNANTSILFFGEFYFPSKDAREQSAKDFDSAYAPFASEFKTFVQRNLHGRQIGELPLDEYFAKFFAQGLKSLATDILNLASVNSIDERKRLMDERIKHLEEAKSTIKNTVRQQQLERRIEALTKERDIDLNFKSRVTSNVTEDTFGNTYLDVIVSNFGVKSFTARHQRVPGAIITRYLLTDEGPKLIHVSTTNSLLTDFVKKSDREMWDYISLLPQAHEDEKNNFNQTLSQSNEYIRRAWGNIARIYEQMGENIPKDPNSPTSLKFTVADFADLKRLTTLIIKDPFNQTLLMHYRSSVASALIAVSDLQENGQLIAKEDESSQAQYKILRQLQKGMERLISEAQLQEENRLFLEVLKQTQSLSPASSPDLAKIKAYIALMEKVKFIPGSKDLVSQMLKTLQGHQRLFDLAKVQVNLQKLLPEFTSTVATYITDEAIFPGNKTKAEETAFFDILPALTISKSPHLSQLFDNFAASGKSIDTWKQMALLIAIDDLFDANGNVRKDVQSIFAITDWDDASKKKLLDSYITHFIIKPLQKKYEQQDSLSTDLQNTLTSLQASNINTFDVFNANKIQDLQNNLLTFAEHQGKPKALNHFISEYTYARNQFALQRTINNFHVYDSKSPGFAIAHQGGRILQETNRLKANRGLPSPSLTRALIATNSAIEKRTDESLQNLADVGAQISKRSAGQVLGGLMISLVGVLLLTASLIFWPVTELLSPDLATKSLAASYKVIEKGADIAGLSAASFSRKKPANQRGFFYPIKKQYERMIDAITHEKEKDVKKEEKRNEYRIHKKNNI